MAPTVGLNSQYGRHIVFVKGSDHEAFNTKLTRKIAWPWLVTAFLLSHLLAA